MLKETETEETIVFFKTLFLSLVTFQLGWARAPWHFGELRNIFYGGENQNEVLPSEREAPGTVPYGKSGPGYCIRKVRRGPEVATVRTKKFNFIRTKHLNWLAKTELMGPRPTGRQYYH